MDKAVRGQLVKHMFVIEWRDKLKVSVSCYGPLTVLQSILSVVAAAVLALTLSVRLRTMVHSCVVPVCNSRSDRDSI